MYDAGTGQIVWSLLPGTDVGRGLEADIDPRFPGDEFWGGTAAGLVDVHGQRISNAPTSVNFAVWWDADPLREIEDANRIMKWDWEAGALVTLLTATGADSNNGTKATPSLSADVFGDWREEVIWRTVDNTALRIYTTTIPATKRMFTLMHDPQYREAIAWQNVGYNQPPHPSFFIGEGMQAPPRPPIVTSDTQAPAFVSVDPSRKIIWPPNHRMVPIAIQVELVDLIDPKPTARIVSVSSNEPVDGAGDGHTVPDWQITGDLTVNLRAERDGFGTGRIYTITIEGRDAAGNTTRQDVHVAVPVTP
jgi:hypothetical protein